MLSKVTALVVLVLGFCSARPRCGLEDHMSGVLGLNSTKPRMLQESDSLQRETDYQPIRIHVHYAQMEVNSKDEEYIRDYIIPGALSWYEKVLKVNRLVNNLTFPGQAGVDCQGVAVTQEHADVGVEADFVIYFTASDSDPTLAGWATTCFIDSANKYQPILGRFHLETGWFDTASLEDTLSTAIHELAHALAFAPSLYPYWVDQNGNRYTNVYESSTVRGKTVYKMKTPKVVQKAEASFGCSSLDGVELELTGGGGTVGAHWEKRIMYGDFMIADSDINDVVYSDITMALFEDSGWYQVDYSYTTNMIWGYQEGCEFFTEKCIQNESPAFAEFCAEADSSRTYCDYKRLHKGYCNLVTYSQDLPSQYQYFSDPRTGGSDEYLDYCPVIKQVDSSNCRGLEQSEGRINSDYGEKVCENCRCLEGTYSKSGSASYHAGCHEVECYDTYALVYFGGVSVQCPFTGGEVEIEGYSGTVICPSTDILCQAMPCPNNCSGQGVCKDGKCECFDGSVGGDCSSYNYGVSDGSDSGESTGDSGDSSSSSGDSDNEYEDSEDSTTEESEDSTTEDADSENEETAKDSGLLLPAQIILLGSFLMA
mmetsp:Transcript_11871/g.17360  ORF Transcript_11871/g.17360 Transcript_11871/m.17360 type:complete len:596 (-) Transcript_11871:2169-3956(-)